MGYHVEVIKGLVEGETLLATATSYTMDDLGASGQTFRTEKFIAGNMYKVQEIAIFNYKEVAWVIDETGCSCWATPDQFGLLDI